MENQTNSRWSDPGIVTIIHNPTEEEKKKGTEEMVNNAVKNLKEFENDEDRKNKK